MSECDSRASYFLRLAAEDTGDYVGHAVPLFGFREEFAFASRREPVILRLALVFRLAPFARDPTLVFEAIQRRVERALLNLQTIFGNLLDAQQNAIAVQRTERNGLENEHVQRALQKV